MEESNWSQHDIFSVHLAIAEAVTNAVNHGNKKDPGKSVYITCSVTNDVVEITIRDEGEGFAVMRVDDPRKKEFLNRPSGRGVFLINGFMSKVVYNEEGNELFMQKFRSPSGVPV